LRKSYRNREVGEATDKDPSGLPRLQKRDRGSARQAGVAKSLTRLGRRKEDLIHALYGQEQENKRSLEKKFKIAGKKLGRIGGHATTVTAAKKKARKCSKYHR